jgi:hypothetical protein
VSEFVIMTLGLLAGVLGCLAMPCAPERWGAVKPPRLPLEPLSALPEPEWLALHEQDGEPGFADGITTAAA